MNVRSSMVHEGTPGIEYECLIFKFNFAPSGALDGRKEEWAKPTIEHRVNSKSESSRYPYTVREGKVFA